MFSKLICVHPFAYITMQRTLAAVECADQLRATLHVGVQALTLQQSRRPLRRASACVNASAQSSRVRQPTALECSRSLAALRVQDGATARPALHDAFASALAEQASASELEAGGAFDMVAARFVDNTVLHAVSLANVGRQQEYNQVVLVGDGMCTRAFRLPWPTGTVIYLVAPGEVHERAEAVLRQLKARVPRGCLLRRVDADLQGGGGFAAGLARAGYRGDRLSVWALQGLTCLQLSPEALGSVLTDMSNGAALESILLGELPCMQLREAQNLLASYGLLGDPVAYADVQLGGEAALWCEQAVSQAVSQAVMGPPRWLFTAQQNRLSLAEMGVYEDHVAAAEEADEDFFGHFS